jgi:hypothetical protein
MASQLGDPAGMGNAGAPGQAAIERSAGRGFGASTASLASASTTVASPRVAAEASAGFTRSVETAAPHAERQGKSSTGAPSDSHEVPCTETLLERQP